MPKRKITLEEAAEAYAQAGLRVKVEAIEADPVPLRVIQKVRGNTYGMPEKPKVLNDMVRITLLARHSMGCAGVVVKDAFGQDTVTANTYQQYGPGVCYVHKDIAAHLLHADAEAQRADERFLDRTERRYALTSRRDGNGRVNYVGVEMGAEGFAAFTSPQQFGGYTNMPLGSI